MLKLTSGGRRVFFNPVLLFLFKVRPSGFSSKLKIRFTKVEENITKLKFKTFVFAGRFLKVAVKD